MANTAEGTADQSTQENTPATVDLSALQTALMSKFDERFQGLQGIMDRRNAELRTELENLKTDQLSPEDREQVQASKQSEELKRIKRENELLRMRSQFPEEVDLLESFLGKESLEDQLKVLAAFRKAQAEAEAQGEPATETPTPVDKNNAPRPVEASLADYQGEMTKNLADKILSNADEKGLFRKLRGR